MLLLALRALGISCVDSIWLVSGTPSSTKGVCSIAGWGEKEFGIPMTLMLIGMSSYKKTNIEHIVRHVTGNIYSLVHFSP